MSGRNQRRRCKTWSNLPTKILGSIAKLLQDDILSLRHFRLVCKNWNHSTTISALLPLRFKTSYYVYTSTVYLVNSSWIISLVQFRKYKYEYRQIFSNSYFVDIPTNFNLNQFKCCRLSTVCHLSECPKSDDYYPFVRVLVFSPKCVPSRGDCAVLALSYGGKLGGYPPSAHYLNNGGDEGQVKLPWIRISYGSVDKFDDIVEFKGMILTVDRQGKLYEIDPYTLVITRAYLTKGVSTHSRGIGWRKRLVATPTGVLYLVVRESVFFVSKPLWKTPLFKVYKLSGNDELRIWVEVMSFGNQVLFVTQDCSFFVGVDGLRRGEMGQNLNSCMVYSKYAFARYCLFWGKSDEWDGYTVPRHKDEVGVYQLDVHSEDNSFRPLSSFQNFPFVLDSCPSWARQSTTSTSRFRSQRKSKEDESKRQEDESKHEMAQDEEEKPNIRNWDDEFDSNHGIDNNQVPESESNNEVTPVMSYRSISLAEQQGSSTGADVESVTRAWACIASASKSSQGDSSKLNFRGLNICMELVPILEKIWSKHGDVMEKIAIRNGDIVAKTLESLANAVQILEENTGRSLNDEQANYLSSTLDDLQLMRFRVDWLAPKIKDALAHNKSKHLMAAFDSLKGVTQFKAQISERRSKLVEEVAKYDQMQKELDSEIAKMHESVPSLAQDLDFDKPLGGLI